MISLNQIKKKLMGYFETHPMVTQTFFVDVEKFGFNREINYGPVVNIAKVPPTQAGKFFTYNFLITIADLTDVNYPELEDEVHSDCLEIANDFTTWLPNQENYFYKRNVNYNYFTDSTGDRVAGITFTVAIPVSLTGCESDSPRQSINDDDPELNPGEHTYFSMPLFLPPNDNEGEVEIV